MAEESKKVNIRRLLNRKELIIVISAFLILLSFFYYIFFTSNHFTEQAPVTFEVKRGESFGSITERLYKRGIIPSKLNFRIAGVLYGAEKKVKAARYYIPNNLSYLGLIDYLLRGKVDYLREIRIFNGTSTALIASRLKSDASVDSALFLNHVNSRSFLESHGIAVASVEGYLLPQTYYMYERSTPEEAATILISGLDRFIKDSILFEVSKGSYDLHEVLTLASIVQGETNKVEEMPRIAGVYYNRLRVGMKLQADPTVQFLLKGNWRRLTYKDLRTDNPYNTYLYEGLPPGPINNPGKDAILAAVYPESNDYFYFVADAKGGHIFSRTFTEHLKNVQAYRNSITR